MSLARSTGGVVVNADSQQLYDGLRVLTARPSEADEAEIPHRLYGVADAGEAWSVGRWLRAVQTVMDEEERPLIFAGGTGLYFNALTRGLAAIPPVDPGARAAVQTAFDRDGETAVRGELSMIDPASEARIAAGDRQRLVRALSVFHATGRSLSDWRREPAEPVLQPGHYLTYVVERPRDDLYARCDARVQAMIEDGALQEVEALLARGLDGDLPVMKAVGVREFAGHVRGESSLEQAVEATRSQTRRFAKRQLTWFRNQASDWDRFPAERLG